MKRLACLLLLVLLLTACGEGPGVSSPAAPTAAQAVLLPTASTRDLPVTFTPVPTTAPVTPTPAPTVTPPGPTATPIDFSQTAVELRYRIPALGLDRRLQGNIASQVIFVDETTGKSLQRNNQAGILLELQQALPEMALEPLPDDCDTCVAVSYDLPVAGEAGAGWLRDPILLASIENLMAVVLGPHFPPDTLLGLRRSASAYAPAHTVAIDDNGQVWRWLATEGEVSPAEEAADLSEAVALVPWERVAAAYVTDCPGVAIESLYAQVGGEAVSIRIQCPEFTLPTTLLPLYLILNEGVAGRLAAVAGPERPPAGFPLTAVLDYRRADGDRLSLFADGSLRAVSGGEVVSETLALPQVLTITTSLIDQEVVQLGLATYFEETEGESGPTSHLLVRGEAGVYDARWSGESEATLPLDELLAELFFVVEEMVPGETEETAVPEETAEPEATTDPASPVGTAEPEPTATDTPEPTATP